MKKHTFLASALFAAATILAVPAQATDLTWAGTSSDNTWSTLESVTNWTSDGSATYFTAGDSVTFSSSTGATTVVISNDLEVGDFTVSGTTAYTFSTDNENGVTISVGTLSVAAGSGKYGKMTIGENVTISATTLTRTGGATYDVNGTLNVSENVTFQGTFGIAQTISGSGTVNVAGDVYIQGGSGGSMTISVANFYVGGNLCLYNYVSSGSTTNNLGTVTLSSENFTIKGNLYAYGGTLTISGSGTIGGSLAFSSNPLVTISEGASVTIGGFSRSGIVRLVVNGTATFTNAISNSPGYATTFSGTGTLIFAEGLTTGSSSNSSNIWTISTTTLKAKSISHGNSAVTFTISSENIYVDSLAVTTGTSGKSFTLGNTNGTTLQAYTDGGTVTISAATTISAGTLTLASDVDLSAEMTISDGVEVIIAGTTLSASANISGGEITLSESGQIKSSDDGSTTISSNVTVVLDSYLSGEYETDGVATVSDSETTYAFSGAVTLSGTLTLSATEELISSITDGMTYEFAIASGDVAGTLSESDFTLDSELLEALANYEYDTSYSEGIYTITIIASSIPEPSLFGIFAGISALAIAGTRRRRAKRA